MNIAISGKHMDVGESLSRFIDEELSKVLTKYVGDFLEAHASIAKDHHLFKLDISVHISRNFIVHCHGEDTDPYKATTGAIEKLESRIRRHKNRLRDLKRQRDERDFTPVQHYVLRSHEEDSEPDAPMVIAESTKEITRLSVSEAVLKLDVMDAPVLMFRNGANDQINVVYRRKDGHIGWIDPSLQVG
jgi:ribosomal subunit interface protein